MQLKLTGSSNNQPIFKEAMTLFLMPKASKNMTTILIGGYYGAGNLGDEAILECILKDLRALRPELEFYVTSWNPNQTSKSHTVTGIHWKDISGLLEACQNSNLIILGGGGLFQDYWGFDAETYLRTSYRDITSYGSLPLLASLLGIPCMIYAVGLGPFKSPEALQHTCFAFENCLASTLRDSDSLDLLLKSGYFNENSLPFPRVLADPVYTLVTNEDDDKYVEKLLLDNRVDLQENLIAVVLRHWDPNETGMSWLKNVASGLKKFLVEYNSFQVILLSFQKNELSVITNDGDINKTFQEFNFQNKYHKLDEQLTPRIAQALIKKCDLVLGMRLHSLIMGINTGTPIVGIPYDPKVSTLMNSAGLKNYCGSKFPPESADIAVKLELAWKNRKQITTIMGQFQKMSCKAAKENSKIALDLISEKPRLPRKFVQQFPIEQIKIINNLDGSLEITTKRNAELLTELESTQIELEKNINDKETAQINLRNISRKLDQEIYEKQSILKVNESRERELSTVRSDLNEIYQSKFWIFASAYYSCINKFKSKFPLRITHQINNLTQTINFLNEIIAIINTRTVKGFFVVTSTLPFDEFYNQRVINLSKFLSNHGYAVLFVTWRWTPSRDLVGDKLEVFNNIFQIPIDLFLEDLKFLKDVNHPKKYFIVEFPHPELYSAALKLRNFDYLLVYEIIDDWESFHTEDQAIWFNGEIEKSLILNSNLVTAVSSPLLRKFSNIRNDIILIPNGYDPDLLGIRNKNISKGNYSHKEINIGYFGHLTNSWFDWGFLINLLELAEEKGINIKFHLIGYGEPDLKFLAKFEKKIIFYGRVNPSELYRHARNWDIAMIPFKVGNLAESVDPIKLYEYLFFGVPVIVRGISHLKNHPFVRLVTTELQFLEAIGTMEKIAQNRDQNKDLTRILIEATWNNRFEQLLKDLERDPWMFL